MATLPPAFPDAGEDTLPSAPSSNVLSSNGNCYQVLWIIENLAGNTSAYMEVTTSPTHYTRIDGDSIGTNGASTFFRVYRNYSSPVIGAAVNVLPIRADSTNPIGMVANELTSVSLVGAQRVEQLGVFGMSGQGNQEGSGASESLDAIRYLPPNSSFLVELENTENAAEYAQYKLTYCEIKPEDMPPIY